MRIISSYHDYYDCIQRDYYCPEPLFIRERTIIQYDYKTFQFANGFNLYISNTTTVEHIIYFCGKVYKCIKICVKNNNCIQQYCKYCYNIEDVTQFINSLDKNIIKEFNKTSRHYPHFGTSKITSIVKRFKDFESEKDDIKKAFWQMSHPIAVSYSSNKTVVINDVLKNIEFQRIVPPQQAFQEIQMWLSNIAVPQKPIPSVSNSDMIEAKGFDLKHSFRKGK